MNFEHLDRITFAVNGRRREINHRVKLIVKHVEHFEHGHVHGQDDPADAGGQTDGQQWLDHPQGTVGTTHQLILHELATTLAGFGYVARVLANHDELSYRTGNEMFKLAHGQAQFGAVD